MIAVTDDLQALLNSSNFLRADLYTITPVGLPPMRWTSADIDITCALSVDTDSYTYTHGGVRLDRDRLRLVAGLETDTFGLTLGVDPDNEPTINGVKLRQAAQRGLLDAARVELDWCYLSSWGPPPAVVGVLKRFVGRAADIDVDRTGIHMNVKSWLVLLDTQVPTQVFQAACRFTLGDANCGVQMANCAESGIVGAGATSSKIPCSLTDSDGTWNGGWVSMTSGCCNGVRRSIRSYTQGSIQLTGPLPWSPLAGDTFSVFPGCDKVMPLLTGGSLTTTVPAVGPFQVTIAGFAQDGGVTQIGAPITELDGDGNSISVDGALTPMTAVQSSPAQGQYMVTGGVYVFASADAGTTVKISYDVLQPNTTASCASRFHNVANFGGTPFIPVPETVV